MGRTTHDARYAHEQRTAQAERVGRRCLCGVPLSIHNADDLCSICQKIKRQMILENDLGARERMRARAIVGVFVQPQRYGTPADYLRALDEAIGELAEMVGITPPDLEEVFG